MRALAVGPKARSRPSIVWLQRGRHNGLASTAQIDEARFEPGLAYPHAISALYRHRRRRVHCAGMLRDGHFEYRHAHTRAMDTPSAMPL